MRHFASMIYSLEEMKLPISDQGHLPRLAPVPTTYDKAALPHLYWRVIWGYSCNKFNTNTVSSINVFFQGHDDLIKWRHFPRAFFHVPFVQGIHQTPVNFRHKCQWREALMSSWISTWINGQVNNHEAGDLRCHLAHYDVTVMRQGQNAVLLSLPWLSKHQHCTHAVEI